MVPIIVEYLNERTGKKFSPKTFLTKKHISGRLAGGHTLDDFKAVIDTKVEEWAGTEMEKFLAPPTLFCEANFEKYLNQGRTIKPKLNPDRSAT